MKNKGFTLVELMVAVAILVIIVGMLTPLMTSITKSNKKTQDINQLDLNLGKSIDVFKGAVRSSKIIEENWKPGGTDTTGTAIYLTSSTSAALSSSTTTDSAIVINVPKESSSGSDTYWDEKVIFYFDSTNKKLMLNSTTGSSFTGVGGDVELVNNVKNAFFGYQNNIATIYLEIKLDKNGSDTDEKNLKKIRDAAVTRINIDF